MNPHEVIRLLALQPHPEGGHYRETFRAPAGPDGRSRATSIYYLLREGETSHWHRIDAVEIWHWYLGAPLELSVSDGMALRACVMGPNIGEGHRPQVIVPAHSWQSARTTGSYTLVGCTVSPGFEFSGFELAPAGFTPA